MSSELNTFKPIEKIHSESYPAISPTLPSLSATGKKILITGGATGIGLSIANSFATAGASQITIIGRTISSLEAAKLSIKSRVPSTHVSIYSASLTDHDAVQAMFAKERAKYGEFDIVVLCAGYVHVWGSALDFSDEDCKNSFDLNVHGNIHLVREYLKTASTSEQPKTIVDISSGAVHNHSTFLALYSITKGAFSNYLQHLDLEFRDAGLRTFSVHPGSIFTALPQKAGMKEGDFAFDHVDLPGHFIVWITSAEGAFLSGRFVWAKWDVDELKSKRTAIEASGTLLKLGLITKV